jgi:PRTRC genetic system ThiF family protein
MQGIDTSYLNAATLLLPATDRLQLHLVGCGGTGSWLAPTVARMARLLKEQRKEVTVHFYDGDVVERKNLFRQNFCDAEVGRNKAITLAARYGLAWGLDIQAHPEYITQDSLYGSRELSIYIGCVDSTQGRKAIHAYVQLTPYHEEHQKLNWWLDCGNAEDSGQVLFGGETKPERFTRGVFGADGKVCRRLPAPSMVEPLLLKPSAEETQRKKQGCADLQLHNDQSLSVNQMVAAIAGDYLLRIVTGTLKKYATYFDLSSGVMRSKYITRENLRQFKSGVDDQRES